MTSTNIPYKERQLGQFYYCQSSSGFREYIFQCNDIEGSDFPCINRRERENWNDEVGNYGWFKQDWKCGTDRILRLATPEEITLIKSKDTERLLINTILEYEIY